MFCIPRVRHAFALAIAMVALVPAPRALAQETRARITGTVVDTQGAIIPGATVTATNTETNVTTEDVTNESGTFNLQQLVPGPYRLSASLQGFKTFIREGIIPGRSPAPATSSARRTWGAIATTPT